MAGDVYAISSEVLSDSIKRKAIAHLGIDDACKHVWIAYSALEHVAIICSCIVSITLAVRAGVDIYDLSYNGVGGMLCNILIDSLASLNFFCSAYRAVRSNAFYVYFFYGCICRECESSISDLSSDILPRFLSNPILILCWRIIFFLIIIECTVACIKL